MNQLFNNMAGETVYSCLSDYKLLSSGAEMSTAAFIEPKSVRCGDNKKNRLCIPLFDHKVVAVALTLWLRLGKTNKRVGNMLPETFPADACFPNVPQFFQKRNSVSGSKKRFLQGSKNNFFLLETMFLVWQNWETLGKHVSAANVSGNMFPVRFSRA